MWTQNEYERPTSEAYWPRIDIYLIKMNGCERAPTNAVKAR